LNQCRAEKNKILFEPGSLSFYQDVKWRVYFIPALLSQKAFKNESGLDFFDLFHQWKKVKVIRLDNRQITDEVSDLTMSI
jgi:hypothetical protein